MSKILILKSFYFDDFQKHTEVLKRMLKEDDEIKPFNNVNNTFTNIFANSLINNMEFKKVFNDKPFSISVMIKKNTKDLKIGVRFRKFM
jgi:hypothetical protein